MGRMIVCRDCTESDCTYCNMNVLAVALERGYFNSLMREQHTVQIDSELVPVKYGKWINDKGIYKCTACNDLCLVAGWAHCIPEKQMYKVFKFCPNCGAKMDGERREDG